jgi:predicted ATP-grasp superfamily ATP-dependent carboligase
LPEPISSISARAFEPEPGLGYFLNNGGSMRNFVIVAQGKPVVMQVLLAIHSFTDANCIVVCARGTRILRFSSLCSGYMEVNFYGEDDNRFVNRINLLSQSMPGLILIPADCPGTRMVNRVRNRLKVAVVPTPDSAMLDRLEDKWSFYQFCKAHGLSVPRTRYIGAKHELDFDSTVRELGTPFVVKPVNEQGSDGVHVVSSESDYNRKIRNRGNYRYGPLIAQQYIRGTDVGLNLLSLHGKVAAIAIQQPVDQDRVGSRIMFFPNDYLQSVAYSLCKAIGYHGVMNVDARIEDGTGMVYLFESNPRFWRTLLASVWCGLNFVKESVEASPHSGKVRMLTSGVADTYYHPLFRASLWSYAISNSGHRGRMMRRMMGDVSMLVASAKALLLMGVGHRSQLTIASAPPERYGGLVEGEAR